MFTYSQILTHEETKPITNAILAERSLKSRDNGLIYEFPITPFGKPMELQMEFDRNNRFDEPLVSEDKMKVVNIYIAVEYFIFN